MTSVIVLSHLKSLAMDRYFTVMIVPEREKGVRSFRIPRVVFHAARVLFGHFPGSSRHTHL